MSALATSELVVLLARGVGLGLELVLWPATSVLRWLVEVMEPDERLTYSD